MGEETSKRQNVKTAKGGRPEAVGERRENVKKSKFVEPQIHADERRR